ncbi:TATA box-binding protein-associated factor RNA polymerase I subunit B [Heracleum sosnowskyi]|uniref:TATA box-binding protein-associated factor RNA polymerase I subunit B n=1 Tax=Heracleum sosnowskyi TaxID=360622 RepID=A0AAD8I0L8_9APIA|nr:TATA box-binding protein-associated factor RNA polymerase I subunit B [Heracleum sosnowskyi]
MEDETLEIECDICGHVGLEDGSDGFYYCQNCGSQANNIRDIGKDTDEFIDLNNPSAFLSTRRRRTAASQPLSESQPQSSQFWESLKQQVDEQQINNNNSNSKDRTICNDVDDVGPTGPMDFGSSNEELGYSDYYSQIRMRYVMGVQVLIQLQCVALVDEFDVNERVVDVAINIWLKFVALSRIFEDDWADEAITQSESQSQGPLDGFVSSGKHRDEPRNLLGQRAVMIWYRSLSKTIPLSHSLVISFLACHVLREAVLPTDILKWIIEGKLPYFAAFADIEKEIDPPPKGCPISSSRMFRPTQVVSSQKFESTAAIIAETVGLELPPVNFFAIASRYLRLMSLSVDKILPYACCIYEWSMPPDCRLSANALRLPTRACVMSILIVSIRILYNLHGFGNWEAIFSGSSCSLSTACGEPELDSESDADLNDVAKHQSTSPGFDAKELLLTLDTKYGDLFDTFDYLKGMPTYLQYDKDVVFTGVGPSFEDIEETKIIEKFWSSYQRRVGLSSSPDREERSSGHNGGDNKRPREDRRGTPMSSKKLRDDEDNSNTLGQSGESHSNKSQSHINQDSSSNESPNSSSSKHSCNKSDREEAVNRLKSTMEENRFCYIPPRDKCNDMNYLYYARKNDEGGFTYTAHADYYILLRSCARVAQIDIRCLHAGVLGFERRLACTEKIIDHFLNVKLPTDTCEFCRDDEVEVNANDEVEVNATDRVEVNATGKVEVNAADDPVVGFSDLNL